MELLPYRIVAILGYSPSPKGHIIWKLMHTTLPRIIPSFPKGQRTLSDGTLVFFLLVVLHLRISTELLEPVQHWRLSQ